MEPIIIFNEKYYPVMDDYTDEKGITKKAPFIQIGETMVRVVQPRKVGDKFWQHLQGSDVKVKKKTDFGTVVENYIQLAKFFVTPLKTMLKLCIISRIIFE